MFLGEFVQRLDWKRRLKKTQKETTTRKVKSSNQKQGIVFVSKHRKTQNKTNKTHMI